ncbi:SDR family oxidoreductase [Granulicella cerasi]|uniref:SDR family oxidoreductase n=1 Tax=Granulicella cerasi TaxID=741063 RepID=A0ABW1Z9V2_9BACT|nr:SDR family oxidoreductase [Granulicella cerasi]
MPSNLYTLQDPTKQYPTPKFQKQPQRVPGLDKKLKPLADHGEESYHGSGRLKGRKALVTGGDSGIGRAVAIAFAREGADVVINYLPSEEADAKEVIALIKAAGRKAYAMPGDLRKEKFARDLVKKAAKKLGGLDIYAAVAGHQHAVEKIADLKTKQIEETFETNVYALIWTTQEALKLMPKGGSIITTASIQATHPSPSLLDYAPTKAAILAFTRALARQVAPDGIRVNCVAPGPVWTPLQVTGGQPQKKIPEFGAETPMGRAGQPVEMSPLYVLLASQESSYVTGEVYGATGGLEVG